jgi:hypothetical protein
VRNTIPILSDIIQSEKEDKNVNPKDQLYDRRENQMPFGGATDIHGHIKWAVTEEEHAEMMARVKKAFGC